MGGTDASQPDKPGTSASFLFPAAAFKEPGQELTGNRYIWAAPSAAFTVSDFDM